MEASSHLMCVGIRGKIVGHIVTIFGGNRHKISVVLQSAIHRRDICVSCCLHIVEPHVRGLVFKTAVTPWLPTHRKFSGNRNWLRRKTSLAIWRNPSGSKADYQFFFAAFLFQRSALGTENIGENASKMVKARSSMVILLTQRNKQEHLSQRLIKLKPQNQNEISEWLKAENYKVFVIHV